MSNSKSVISSCALGVSLGIVWAISLFLFAIGNLLFSGWASGFIALFSEIYLGYSGTVAGALIGVVWGFVVGFIVGFIIAFLYNFVLRHCQCSYCRSDD